MVRGFQGDDLKEPYKIASCVKHFAGYGAPTAGRDYNTVELSEHTFRDFYLPSYKAGIDAGAAMVMTSFNTVNGVPATGNKKLMRGILRDEMGFDGVLISDWAAIEEIIYHGYCADREAVSYTHLRFMKKAEVKKGKKKNVLKEYWPLYLMMLPALLYLLINNYIPCLLYTSRCV